MFGECESSDQVPCDDSESGCIIYRVIIREGMECIMEFLTQYSTDIKDLSILEELRCCSMYCLKLFLDCKEARTTLSESVSSTKPNARAIPATVRQVIRTGV